MDAATYPLVERVALYLYDEWSNWPEEFPWEDAPPGVWRTFIAEAENLIQLVREG